MICKNKVCYDIPQAEQVALGRSGLYSKQIDGLQHQWTSALLIYSSPGLTARFSGKAEFINTISSSKPKHIRHSAFYLLKQNSVEGTATLSPSNIHKPLSGCIQAMESAVPNLGVVIGMLLNDGLPVSGRLTVVE
jgi:hypothetical protein